MRKKLSCQEEFTAIWEALKEPMVMVNSKGKQLGPSCEIVGRGAAYRIFKYGSARARRASARYKTRRDRGQL